jgi:hypothetical protein
MRAIVINPFERAITEIDCAAGLDDIYKAISHESKHKVDIITAINIVGDPFPETGFIDDEGMLKEGIPVFNFRQGSHPIAGKCIVFGVSPDGDNKDCTLTVEDYESMIQWTNLVTTGDFGPSREYQEGGFFVFHGGQPILKEL